MDFIVSWLSFMLSSGSLFFALGATIFWARSAFVRIPDLPETALSDGAKSVSGIMQKQSRLNANAAGCAAASVVAQILLKTI